MEMLKMDWYFIDKSIVTEKVTGYTIRLNEGTWTEPLDITPDKVNLSPYEQARLLRLGLEFARKSVFAKTAYKASKII